MGKDQKISFPKEAQVMGSILKDMGVTDYEPGVVNQMLEFTYSKFFFIFLLLLCSYISSNNVEGRGGLTVPFIHLVAYLLEQ